MENNGTEVTVQEQIDKLKCERILAWKSLTKISSMLNGLQEIINEVKIQHGMAKLAYERIDHKLALIDGRMQKIKSAGDVEKERKKTREGTEESTTKLMDRLSQEQIQHLLERMERE